MHQILVVGGMTYVGDDAATKQTATAFAGNSAIKELIETNKTDVKRWLKHLTTVAE
jgi:hypothetical protein